MSFVPPTFGDFGKSVKDLLKKKFDYNYEVATKHKASKGVTVEASGKGAGGSVTGATKVNYKSKDFGSVEVKLNTTGKEKDQSAKVTLNQLGDGLEVVLSGDARPAGKAEVTYAQDFFTGNLTVDSNGSNASFVGSGVIGHDGLSVGAEVQASSSGSVDDYNVGCQYAQPDFTMSLKTANSSEHITASYFQKVSGSTQVGTQFFHNPEKDVRELTFGLQHTLDADTTVKTKVNSNGVLAAAIEHRLNQGPLLGVAGSFNLLSKDPLAAQQFGISLKFGDF